jgi:hypothetical protein
MASSFQERLEDLAVENLAGENVKHEAASAGRKQLVGTSLFQERLENLPARMSSAKQRVVKSA